VKSLEVTIKAKADGVASVDFKKFFFCPALPAAFKKLTASRQFNYKNVFRSPALPAAFSYGARRVEKVLPLMRHKNSIF
jgi:hypothetical protein